MYELSVFKVSLTLYCLLIKIRPTIKAIAIIEETRNTKDLFPLVEEVHYGRDVEFRSRAKNLILFMNFMWTLSWF